MGHCNGQLLTSTLATGGSKQPWMAAKTSLYHKTSTHQSASMSEPYLCHIWNTVVVISSGNSTHLQTYLKVLFKVTKFSGLGIKRI